MQKNIQFNAIDSLIVGNEKISGIAVNFNALQADGVTLANLADYNKVGFDVILERRGQKPIHIHNGYLENYILGLYAQTPAFELWHTARGTTYKVKIDFGGIIDLRDGDKLTVQVNARNTTFTSLHVGNSSINVETIPAEGSPSPIYTVHAYGIPKGETNVSFDLGDNVVKVVAATDYTTDYFASNEAKFDGVEITANGGFKKNVTQTLLEIENIDYFNNNPESEIEDLVLYSGLPIHKVNLRGKLTKAIAVDSNLIVVKREYV
ncbi:hypothetical protein [Flagellimonas sp.]|uniref:hypothetical protein n=1 Tax=Flagellimonas sp. TaxID=2058762 RepID=UPI003BAD5626